jgi:hypothetical protein
MVLTLVKKNPCYNKCRSSQPHKNNREVFIMKDTDIQSLEHTKWRCQYHIVFAPKYR